MSHPTIDGDEALITVTFINGEFKPYTNVVTKDQ